MLALGEQEATFPAPQKHWDKALLDVAFTGDQSRIQLSWVFAMFFVAPQLYLKNEFEDRSMSRSQVRINLRRSLLLSPDVLSKGEIALSN